MWSDMVGTFECAVPDGCEGERPKAFEPGDLQKFTGEMIRSRRRRMELWRKQEAGPLIRVLPKYKYCTFFYLHQKEDKPTDPRTWGFLPRRKAFLRA